MIPKLFNAYKSSTFKSFSMYFEYYYILTNFCRFNVKIVDAPVTFHFKKILFFINLTVLMCCKCINFILFNKYT